MEWPGKALQEVYYKMLLIVHREDVQKINCVTFEKYLSNPVLCIFYAITGFLIPQNIHKIKPSVDYAIIGRPFLFYGDRNYTGQLGAIRTMDPIS